MGSGSSTKQNTQGKEQPKTEKGETTPETLIGSSSPPKGMPYDPGANRSSKKQMDKLRETTVQNGTESKATIDGQSGNDVISTGMKGNTMKNGRTSAMNDAKRHLQSAIRPKSRGRKSMVRQMERGMEDEDEMDSFFGLDRMMTKMQLKRERTRMRKSTVVQDRKQKQPTKFMKAAGQIISEGIRRPDEPRSKLDELYLGNAMVECPSTVRVVRIFTSSTFTDTEKERNELMINAYPKLTTFCHELGYEFQVVDMRWGIRDEATDDHMGTEICLREINLCQKLSTGPNFVSLLSHKYGYTDFPRSIEATEFEEMMGHIDSNEVLITFEKWYTKDENSVPPAYIASRISSILPDYINANKEKRDVAKKQWWKESELMQKTLEEIALKIFDAKKARKYVRSVTETEVTRGLLDVKNANKSCLWIKRTISDLGTQKCEFLLSRYTECEYNNQSEKVEKVQSMLKDLRDVRMTEKLRPENILKYNVKWNSKEGIDPNNDHKEYLQSVSRDFVNIMCKKIKTAIEERKITEDPNVHEIAQHIQFCQERCLTFQGRQEVLMRVKNYVTGMSNEPLVVHGVSGSGKTSTTAMITKEAWQWTDKKAAIIFRFIGTTPESSTLAGLLSSITSQIRKAFNTTWTESKDLRTLVDEFQSSLSLASAKRPLVLVIDSLDMLDPSHNARQLQWLPFKLGNHVKVIVSTLIDIQYEAFPVLQTTIKSKDNFVEIPKLLDNDVMDIITKWLEVKQRRLNKDQIKILTNAFTKCPIPLFLKLSFDKACTWTSFAPNHETVLDNSVRESIDTLFKRMEENHGQVFVSRALGYITAARAGLTETEIHDVLSCDNDVLADVYMYWTPPIKRLPPLLYARLRADIEEYLANRRVDNVHVTYWYHRQFIEAAQARYCANTETTKMLHSDLADFFQGVWADGKKKPFTDRKGKTSDEDRHVTSQPLMFGHAYNLRKLNNLPYHRCKAGQLDLLKKECLCNIEFILTKLQTTSLWTLIDDFDLAVQTFPEDELLVNIKEVLHLSQEGLMYDSHQLIPQILGRMTKTKHTESFLKDCRNYPLPSILPNKCILTQPGGQLVHKMAGHRGEILSIDLMADSSKAITSSDDNTVRIWDVRTGKQIRMLDGIDKVSRALFCNNDTGIYLETSMKLRILNVKTGDKILDIDEARDEFPSCLIGEGKTKCVVFKEHTAALFDLNDGTEYFKIELNGNFAFKYPAIASGSKNYAAVTTRDQIYLTVLDIRKKQFTPMFRGFEPFTDDELDESIQYEIDELAITPDEKHVIYSNIYTNDINFLDFKAMKKIRVIKGNPNDYVRSLTCSANQQFIYFVKGACVAFVNLKTSETNVELEHTVDVTSARTNDLKTIVTIAEDSNVRVFDRTRKEHKMSNTPGVSANRIRKVCLHPNSRYMVGFGFKTRDADSQFIFVYDLVNSCAVREKALDSSILQFTAINSEELLVLNDVEYKLKVVSMDKLEINREFQGYLPERLWNFIYVESRKEVVCLSRGRRNVKVYDYMTGRTVAIFDSKQENRLAGITVNEGGSILISWCDEEIALIQIYDLNTRRLTNTIKHQKASFSADEIKLSADGKLLLFTVETKPSRSKVNLEETILEVWDTKKDNANNMLSKVLRAIMNIYKFKYRRRFAFTKGTKISEIVDMEYYNKYYTSNAKQSSAVDSFVILDNKQILVAHDDYIVRLFDMHTGNLIRRLVGHQTGVEIVNNPSSPYILTYGSWEEENALRVWDRTTMECKTSYTMDKMATQLNFSKDGQFILAVTGKPAEIVVWNFNNFNQTTLVTANYPNSFKGQNSPGDPYLDLVPEDETMKVDPNDLDQDLYAESSDDEDDFM